MLCLSRSSGELRRFQLAAGVADVCEGSTSNEGCDGREGSARRPLMMTAKLQLAVKVLSLLRMLCSTRSFMGSPRRLPTAARVRLAAEVATAAQCFGLRFLRGLQCAEVAMIPVWNLRMKIRLANKRKC